MAHPLYYINKICFSEIIGFIYCSFIIINLHSVSMCVLVSVVFLVNTTRLSAQAGRLRSLPTKSIQHCLNLN